jgi:diguanylate cyclase (GGDEF)-like protein
MLLSAVFAVAAARPALADDHDGPNFRPTCHAATAAEVPLEAMIAPAAWNCTSRGWRSDLPAGWLRFEAAAWQDEALPRYFITRAARHERITLAALDNDGTLRHRSYHESAGRPFAAGPLFALDLPEITPATRAVIVRIDKPHSVPLLARGSLSHRPGNADWSPLQQLLLPLLLGMMVMPLLFSAVYFIVLRERFVLLHALMAAGMMVFVLTGGGLISLVVALPVPVLGVVAPLSWAIVCGAALLFVCQFLERGALSPVMERVLWWGGIWTMVVPGFFAFQPHFLHGIDDPAYFAAITPAAGILTVGLVQALRRGSRSARIVAVAWAPLLAASLERLARGLGLYAGPNGLDHLIFLAASIEVVVISLAIADRFLAIRRERDAALDQARVLEHLSTRDSLTGLMNRRAIEARFDELLEQGFDTFALLDLDRFKAVNDVHGHQIGDAALVACAAALRTVGGDRDTVAVRLGGEEFVVLLRGDQAIARAEALRQAIPRRIATDVPGLGLPVTASMGLIEMPRAMSSRVSFAEFYARADILLYEAKASGRNRMAYERLTLFSEAPKGRNDNQPKVA